MAVQTTVGIPSQSDGSVPVTIIGGSSGGTQYTEDAAAAADPVGAALILVRKDTLAAITTDDGDNVAARGTNKGELYVKHTDSIPITDNSGSLTVDNAGVFAVQADTELPAAAALGDTDVNPTVPGVGAFGMYWNGSSWRRMIGDGAGLVVKGAIAADAVSVTAHNIFPQGGRASAAVPSDVSTDNDAVMAWFLRSGAQAIQQTFGGVLGLAGNGGSGTGVQRVTIANDSTGILAAVTSITNTVTTKDLRAATSAVTAVSDSASNVTLLALNANRLGATITNDSSAPLYLKLGATATTSSYTARLLQFGYYEVPANYTGIIDGIWSSDPNDGAARVTELTA